MSYTVSATDLKKIQFNEEDTVNAVLQNIAVILSTPMGTVPLCRDFGLDWSFLDKPTPVAKVLMVAPVREAIARVKERIPELDARVYLAEGSAPCWTGETIGAARFFPAWTMEENHPLVQKALAGLRGAGIEARLSHFAFCTNGSSFCGERGIPTIGFGPSLESLAHVVDEYIEISQLEDACRGFQGILRELLR